MNNRPRQFTGITSSWEFQYDYQKGSLKVEVDASPFISAYVTVKGTVITGKLKRKTLAKLKNMLLPKLLTQIEAEKLEAIETLKAFDSDGDFWK